MGGAGAGQKDEDKERNTPEYLRDYNDEFLERLPPSARRSVGENVDLTMFQPHQLLNWLKLTLLS